MKKWKKHKIKLEKDNGTILIKKTNIKKKYQKISKYLKISLMLFFKRGFVRLGSVLHIFLDHRKSQKISKNLKQTQKIKTSQKNLKISQICWKKAKKTRKKQVTLLRVIPTMTFQNSLLTPLLSEAFVTGLLPN